MRSNMTVPPIQSGCFQWLAALGLLFALAGPYAADAAPADLYQAAVPVSGQGAEERNAAVRQALDKVLIRVTGNRTPGVREQTRGMAAEAESLVQQYRYETKATAAGQPDARTLVVRFDPAALQAVLRERGLPAWGEPRPSLLLWLGLEDQGQRRFFQAELDQDLLGVVDQVAADRGVPVVLPIMDVEDLSVVRAGDIWGGFEERVRQASARYGPDLILLGRLRPSGGSWAGSWELLQAERAEAWQTSASTRAETAEGGLQSAVDRIAARYAPGAAQGAAQGLADGVLVQVRGVGDFRGYLRAERFLRSLDAVEGVELVQAEADQVLFRLGVRGGRDALRLGASLGQVLTPEPAAEMPAAAGSEPTLLPDLSFRLAP